MMRAARGLLAAGLLLLCPAIAWAIDPISVFAFVEGAFGAGVAGVVATIASYISVTTVLVVASIYGSAEARRKQRAAQAAGRAAYNAGLQDRNVTALRSDPPWRTVYGRCITGGEIVAIFTSDKAGTRTDGTAYTKADAYKHLVIVISARLCEAINEVYVDGVALGALDGNGNVTGGELYSAQTETREISIAAGASSTQPSAVTVLSCWDEVASVFASGGDAGILYAAPYTLTSGDTVINNTGSNAMRVSFTLVVNQSGVRVQKHLGDPDQAADSLLTSTVPTEWGAADRLRGLCYAVITLDLENQRFQGGPPNITFDVSGAKVYDPRSGLTAWSANPALCIRDYLTYEGGFNCTAADIDDAFCIAAANACDATITLTVGESSSPGALYTCNGVVTTDQSREAVLQDLAECMAGTVTYGAQWLIQAGLWTVPVMALTDDDLHGQAEIVQGGAGIDETFNTVRGQYVPAGGSAPADFEVYTNYSFVAADGVALYTDIALPFTDNKARCRNLARITVERNRDSLMVRYPAKLRAWPLQIGDRVTLSSAEYGWNAKTFRVTDWQFGLGAPVLLLLQEDAPETWDLADATVSDPAANTALPNPWVVQTPASVTATSGTGVPALSDATLNTRVRVGWAAPADPYLADGGGTVLVRWRRQFFDAANVWQTLAPVPASEIYTFIAGAQAGDGLTIEVRFRNSLGALSPAVYVTHTVGDNASTVRTEQISAEAVTAGASTNSSTRILAIDGDAAAGTRATLIEKVAGASGIDIDVVHVGSGNAVIITCDIQSLQVECNTTNSPTTATLAAVLIEVGVGTLKKAQSLIPLVQVTAGVANNDGGGHGTYNFMHGEACPSLTHEYAGYSGSKTFRLRVGYNLLNAAGAPVAPGTPSYISSLEIDKALISVKEFKR